MSDGTDVGSGTTGSTCFVSFGDETSGSTGRGDDACTVGTEDNCAVTDVRFAKTTTSPNTHNAKMVSGTAIRERAAKGCFAFALGIVRTLGEISALGGVGVNRSAPMDDGAASASVASGVGRSESPESKTSSESGDAPGRIDPRSSSTSVSMFVGRPSRLFDKHPSIVCASDSPTLGQRSAIGMGQSARMRARTAVVVGPVNGGSPATIS